ncbi:MAG: Ig-like domain-containing protein [Promethearchaeota archaeon]
MISLRNRVLLMFFLITFSIAPIYTSSILSFKCSYSQDDNYILYPQAINRTGKIFSNTTLINTNCYINRELPGLNTQPEIYIPYYNISHAKMSFENITAINYTRYIEEDFSEFITSSEEGPKYIFQKFSVEIDQYINNVSVLIQDINNPVSFTDENSWEITIVNCTNTGTPNTEETLGILVKPHPLVYAAHWEVFDFKNSGLGPIYLDTSNTNMTIEHGTEKYWFAFRIKIPQDDTSSGGGPKFLYFNPDGEDANNIGEGATFAISPDFYFDDYTLNNVITSVVTNGTYYEGSVDSYKNNDNDRYLIGDTNNATIEITFELQELKNSIYTYLDLFLQVYKQLYSAIGRSDFNWWFDHYKYIFSFDFYLMVNVSDETSIESASLSIYNYKAHNWETLDYDIINETETVLYFSIRDPLEKFAILSYMGNYPLPTQNNTLKFKLEYIGRGINFNVSINQFKVEVGELANLDTIQPYDPLIQELYFSNGVNIINGTTSPFGSQTIESLQFNDEDYYKAQALSNNLTFFFTYNVLEDLDSSLWNVDYYDWLASYPNPIVPLMDIRLTSNVSAQNNLTLAALALYKGDIQFDILDEETNKGDWILMSDYREFELENETTVVLPFDAGFTWIFLNILNESLNNEANFVLIYLTNETDDYQFNVSINEFSVNMYIQNAISSDISSSLGLGINSNTLTPSDIGLQNYGIDVTDNGIGKGTWEADIDHAEISQGFFEFNVTSKWHSIRFDVSGTYELFKIQPFLEFIESPARQYMTGTRFFSVRVFESGGVPLDNIEIIFEVINANNLTIYESTSITNDQGIATGQLKFENTGTHFTVRIRFAEAGIYTSAKILSEYIKVVSQYTLFMDSLMRYLPYIIGGIAAVVAIVSIRSVKHSRQRRFWAGEAKILDDLLKIAYIMIIEKNSGVSIYDKQISLEGIDSDLISGFLQAISHFRTEIKKGSVSTEKGKGFEMDYYDFKIIITDGEYVRVALILDGTPSEKLKESQIAFTESFESRYKSSLKSFSGDITEFRTSDDLIEKYFNVTFVYPLQLGKHYGVIKLKGLEKDLTEVAEQIQKERKFFFVSSLLNFGLAGRKASRDEIISAIISLKRKGMIIPAEIQ